MFPEESDKIKRYVGGLLDMIHGSVVASRPKIMQDAIKMATKLMDKKIRTFAERQTENKRKQDDKQQQQQQNKRQKTRRAYTIRSGTDIKEMDKNQSKNGQSQTREGKSPQEPGIIKLGSTKSTLGQTHKRQKPS
ncbi:hypothetical protein Tco_0244333, partial [Tanacetum coccineum]